MTIGRRFEFTATIQDYDGPVETTIIVHAGGFTEALQAMENNLELKGNPTIKYVEETF